MIKRCSVIQEMKKPVELVIGENYLLPALEFALVDMEPGEEKALRLAPDHGYGYYMPDLVFTVNSSRIPPDSLPEIGEEARDHRARR